MKEIIDTAYMKRRNYRQVMFLRYQNEKEERLLNQKLYSKRGIESVHRYHISQIEETETSIRQELKQIHNSTTTTCGFVPHRFGKPGDQPSPVCDPFKKQFEAEKLMKKKTRSPRRSPDKRTVSNTPNNLDALNSQRTSPTKTPVNSPGMFEQDNSNLDINKARKNIFSRLAQPKKYEDPRQTEESPVFGRNEKMQRQKAFIRKTPDNNQEYSSQTNSPVGAEPQQRNRNSLNVVIIYPDDGPKYKPGRTKQKMSVNISPSAQHNSNYKQIDNSNESQVRLHKHIKQGRTSQSPEIKETESKHPIFNMEKKKKESSVLPPIKEKSSDKSKEISSEKDPSKNKRMTKQNSFTNSFTRGSSFLNGSKGGVTKKKLKQLDIEKLEKDEKSKYNPSEKDDKSKYNPDGSLRTVYLLPDFQTSIDAAHNARYLRTKDRVWFEREMSVSEIWKDKDTPLKQKLPMLC